MGILSKVLQKAWQKGGTMDFSTNYVNFIRKIYSLEKSESNHLALMELFSLFEFSEMQGFNTDLSYDTMSTLAGFYPEIMDELAHYSKLRREKCFKNAATLNKMAETMVDELWLYGKKAGNHAKPANARYDARMINNWFWTDDYIVAGNTILYMELKDINGIARVPAYLAQRYIERLGQGSLRIGEKQLEKVVIDPSIKEVAAQPELIHTSVLELTQGVTKVEIPQDILGTTKIFFRLSPEQADRYRPVTGYKTADGGCLLSSSFMGSYDTSWGYYFPQVNLYRKKNSQDSFDLDYKLKFGDAYNDLSHGPYLSFITGDASRAMSLCRVKETKSFDDIDRIGSLLVDNMCEKERQVIRKGVIRNLYCVFYDREDGLMLQILIGICLHYAADVTDVRYKGRKYEIFRAFNANSPSGESHAFMIADENGCLKEDDDTENYYNVKQYYMRRFRLINILK